MFLGVPSMEALDPITSELSSFIKAEGNAIASKLSVVGRQGGSAQK